MGTVISLLFNLLVLYIVYWLFENYNFKTVLIANIAYKLIVGIVSNGMSNLFLTIIILVVAAVIETYIDKYAYESTNSFGGFLLVGIAVSFVISFVIGIVMSFLLASSIGLIGI